MRQSEELKNHLKSLMTTPGLSGYENPIRAAINTAWAPLVDEITTSHLGSVHAIKRSGTHQPSPSLMLAAHMDSIGLMVTDIQDGYLHVTNIGGIDPRILPGQPVLVHGRKSITALVIQTPKHLLPEQTRSGTPQLKHMLVDTGLSPDQVVKHVRIGDVVSFAQTPIEMKGDIIAGPSLDNRASIAAITHCLSLLQNRQLKWDVIAVATVQEEETFGGGYTSAFQLQPSLAIAIDVTYGKAPGSPAHKTYPIGKGLAIGWGPNVHPYLHNSIKNLAEKLEIPHSIEIMPRHSGTDAYSIQVSAAGIPTMVLSIPLRYMHSPVEMVSTKDIERVGRLVAEFAASLETDYLDQIKWEE